MQQAESGTAEAEPNPHNTKKKQEMMTKFR